MGNLAIHFEYTRLEELVISNGKTLQITHISSNTFSLNSKPFSFQNIVYVLFAYQNLFFVNAFTCTNHVSLEFFPNHFLIEDLASQTILYKGSSNKGLYSFSLNLFKSSFGGYNAFSSALSIWHARL